MLKLKKVIATSLIVVSILVLSSVGASAEWKSDSNGWWYTEGSAYATGWRNIDGNWYYFYSDGYMATCDKIDGYFVNSNGVWTDSITAEEARQLILNEDGKYIKSQENYYTSVKLSNDGEDTIKDNEYYSMPEESCYVFRLHYYEGLEESCEPFCYLVGKNSKNIYSISNQAYCPIYQIENNQKVKIFKCLREGVSVEWR